MKLQGKAEEEQRISPVPTFARLTDSTKLAALSATGQHIYFRWMDSSSVFVSPTQQSLSRQILLPLPLLLLMILILMTPLHRQVLPHYNPIRNNHDHDDATMMLMIMCSLNDDARDGTKSHTAEPEAQSSRIIFNYIIMCSSLEFSSRDGRGMRKRWTVVDLEPFRIHLEPEAPTTLLYF